MAPVCAVGSEFNLSLLAAVAALALTGPGRLSLDSALGIHLPKAPVLAAGGVAVVAGVLVALFTRRPAAASPEPGSQPEVPAAS